LLCDACDALAAGQAERACSLLTNYLDANPQSTFARMALAREQQRRIIDRLNAALATGDYRAVRKVFKEALEDGRAYAVLADFEALPRALEAFQAYLDRRPFPSSKAMRAARRRLVPHLPMLNRSPAFRTFWTDEESDLKALEARETAIAVRRLVAELDATAVSGGLSADLLLAHLGALAPDHPVYRAADRVLAGDWVGLRRLALVPLKSGEGFGALEIACCLAWTGLDDRERRVLGKLFARGEPESLSGLFLRAWTAAAGGRFDRASRLGRMLAGIAPPRPALIGLFLTRCVLPPAQFHAWCWRSPAPGVMDFWGRIEQLNEFDPTRQKASSP
jgi:hypothetical protein